MDKFWMVFVEGNRNPAQAHTTKVSAENEAERLCLATHKQAFVLEAIASYHMATAIRNELEEIQPNEGSPV